MDVKLVDPFEQIIKKLESSMAREVDNSARRVAKNARRNAPVDTSALRESIYVVSEKRDDYGAAISDVARVNPHADILPSASIVSGEEGFHQAAIEAPVGHASLVHNGTSRTPARPFLEQAISEEESEFQSGVRAALKRL